MIVQKTRMLKVKRDSRITTFKLKAEGVITVKDDKLYAVPFTYDTLHNKLSFNTYHLSNSNFLYVTYLFDKADKYLNSIGEFFQYETIKH